MATILNAILDFTDVTIRNPLSKTTASWINGAGDNLGLASADDYYQQLLRDRGIASDDPDLASPPPFTVKEVMRNWLAVKVCIENIEDSQAPFDGQVIIGSKWERKLKRYQEQLEIAEGNLDDNAFYDTDKSFESGTVAAYSR